MTQADQGCPPSILPVFVSRCLSLSASYPYIVYMCRFLVKKSYSLTLKPRNAIDPDVRVPRVSWGEAFDEEEGRRREQLLKERMTRAYKPRLRGTLLFVSYFLCSLLLSMVEDSFALHFWKLFQNGAAALGSFLLSFGIAWADRLCPSSRIEMFLGSC